MAISFARGLRGASSLLKSSSPLLKSVRFVPQVQDLIYHSSTSLLPTISTNPIPIPRNFSHGAIKLVTSEGKSKFEAREVDPPRKYKWRSKKSLKLKRKREKEERRAANTKGPRRLNVKGKKRKFANAEERIKHKLEKAKIKESLLIEKLKRYEVSKVQGPEVQPHKLTGEELFYLKKTAQKRSNYAPIGRRGVFGGVILNMHMHWKKHETVKIICKNCNPDQVRRYADELARLSGGFPINIIGDDTIVFYRGKNYVQPEVMSPIDTLSKKKALEKSKYEQSLVSVRRFIAIAEKELEIYYRHVALYGDPNNRNPLSILNASSKEFFQELSETEIARDENQCKNELSLSFSDIEVDSEDEDKDDDDELSALDEEERLSERDREK